MKDLEKRKQAALKAWTTMRGPAWKAKRSARLSQRALEEWADEAGFKVVFLDAASGNPRTGIVDAVLLRIQPRAADQLEVYLVQLKGGAAGFKPYEMARLALGGRFKTDIYWTGKTDIFSTAETCEFYFELSSVRKSACSFVRQLRGPHLRTCA